MICEILTVCKDAIEENGAFTIEGACNRLKVPFIPGILKELVVAVRVCSESHEDGPHFLQLLLSDADGKSLGLPCEGQFETRTLDQEQYAWTHAVIRLSEIQIGKPNDYLLGLP